MSGLLELIQTQKAGINSVEFLDHIKLLQFLKTTDDIYLIAKQPVLCLTCWAIVVKDSLPLKNGEPIHSKYVVDNHKDHKKTSTFKQMARAETSAIISLSKSNERYEATLNAIELFDIDHTFKQVVEDGMVKIGILKSKAIVESQQKTASEQKVARKRVTSGPESHVSQTPVAIQPEPAPLLTPLTKPAVQVTPAVEQQKSLIEPSTSRIQVEQPKPQQQILQAKISQIPPSPKAIQQPKSVNQPPAMIQTQLPKKRKSSESQQQQVSEQVKAPMIEAKKPAVVYGESSNLVPYSVFRQEDTDLTRFMSIIAEQMTLINNKIDNLTNEVAQIKNQLNQQTPQSGNRSAICMVPNFQHQQSRLSQQGNFDTLTERQSQQSSNDILEISNNLDKSQPRFYQNSQPFD